MFAGTGTALITPFTRDGDVDEDSLRRLVRFQEDNGVDTLVPCGSTGESAMLSHEEHLRVISIVRDEAKRAKVLAGAGSNCTTEAVQLSKDAEDLGADGILSISPYYVKPTQEGIYRHYSAIESAIDIPIVVYNIPGRTGSNISVDTMLRLAELDGIVGVKEASGNMSQIQNIIARRPEGFEVISGDDSITLALMAMGADGVISTAANLLPREMSALVRSVRENNLEEARKIHYRVSEALKLFFEQGNPPGIKAGLHIKGLCGNVLRLPLVPVTGNLYERLAVELERLDRQ